jgi:hypothetical protein
VGRALPGSFNVLFDNVLNFIQIWSLHGIEVTDANEELVTDEHIDFTNLQYTPVVLENIKKNECVFRKVFDLRDLIVIKAIFNRKGMESEQLNESREFFPCWTVVVQPGKTTIPCGCCNSINSRLKPLRGAVVADLIKEGAGHVAWSGGDSPE